MQQPQSMQPCVICQFPGAERIQDGNRSAKRNICGNCGVHVLANSALGQLLNVEYSSHQHARLAHAIYKRPTESVINASELDKILKTVELPGALECIDNLLMFLASLGLGTRINRPAGMLQAAIGTDNETAAEWVVQQAVETGLVGSAFLPDHENRTSKYTIHLTAAGWARHGELIRNGAGSRHAFMAMKFNDAELDGFFANHLQPAVADTGFKLRKTNHPDKPAGLIDNRMRVELRTSRFVVCDLTHGNQGAYWEAGFAEGLGRSVIYLCRHNKLASKAKGERPHFDTAHQAIVAWNPDDPGPCVAELKAMIRATLPAEAWMEDPAPGGRA